MSPRRPLGGKVEMKVEKIKYEGRSGIHEVISIIMGEYGSISKLLAQYSVKELQKTVILLTEHLLFRC
jgi:hypothetical protein